MELQLQNTISIIEERLKTIIPLTAPPTLYKASNYALLSGGKRLRPLIPLLIIQDNDYYQPSYLDIALSLELIHTYSLVHDDLPCMDDDDYRRGKPSTHIAFGESTAVLAGDFLLTYAFELIANQETISLNERISFIQKLTHASGHQGLIAGQILDLHALNCFLSKKQLDEILIKKTALLFACAFNFAAIMVKASEQETKLFNKLGLQFGLIFQYLDDLQDYKEDLKNESNSSLRLFSIDNINRMIQTLKEQMRETIDLLPYNLDSIYSLIQQLIEKAPKQL